MECKKNILWKKCGRHLLASFTGEGGCRDLARDFYRKENIWDPEIEVPYRWAKLAWVNFAAAVTQLLIPGIIVFLFSYFIKGPFPLQIGVYVVGGMFLVVFIFLMTVQFFEYRAEEEKISRRSGRQ